MQIRKLVPSRKGAGLWVVHLEDGTLLRVSEREVLDFALFADQELDAETLAQLTAQAQKSAMLDRGLRLLSVRAYSRKALLQKLLSDATEETLDAEKAAAELAVQRLEELGYLDDCAYAESIARHYSAKGYGARRLRDEFYRRGIPRPLWDAALAAATPPEAPIDALLRQKLKGTSPDRKELKRVSDALARRGYSWDEISAGLRRYGAASAEADAP